MTVSIVVPVYNTVEYLSRCIDSCLNQTYADIELILVDDGSSDGSSDICKSYLESDSRVKFLSQQNRGASVARNVGIDASEGDFLLFVDSDDWIEHDMVFDLVSVAVNHPEVQVVQTRVPSDMKIQQGSGILSGPQAVRCLLEGSWWTPSCKLLRRDSLGDERFPIKTISEDYLFNYQLFNKIGYLYYLDKCYYYRTSRPNSLSKIELSKRKFDEFHNVKEVRDRVSIDYPQYKLLADSHLAGTCLKLLFLIFENRAEKQYPDETALILDCIRDNFFSFLKNPHISNHQRVLLASCFSKYSARFTERLYHSYKSN